MKAASKPLPPQPEEHPKDKARQIPEGRSDAFARNRPRQSH